MKKYVDETILENLVNKIEEIEKKMVSVENCYPVGAVYISTTITNPNTIFGFGKWE